MPLAIWPQPVQLINVTHALPTLPSSTGPKARVYRLSMWPYHKWRASFRGVGYVCARCVRNTRDWHREWKRSVPCVNCGRPVVHDYSRLTPKRAVCGPACKQEVHNKPHLRLAPLHEFHCEMCGKLFLAKRSDAFYCSAPCRLRASRQSRQLMEGS
jgi:hypothetical protein